MKDKVAVFDLDNTIIRFDTTTSFLGYILNKKNKFFKLNYRIKSILLNQFFRRNYDEKIYGLELIKNMTDNQINELISNYLKTIQASDFIHPVLDLLNKAKKEDFKIILLSAAIEPLVKSIGEQLSVDLSIGTKLDKKRNQFTGKHLTKCYGENKLTEFLRLNPYEIDQEYSFFVSDHISDLPTYSLFNNKYVVVHEFTDLEWADNKFQKIII